MVVKLVIGGEMENTQATENTGNQEKGTSEQDVKTVPYDRFSKVNSELKAEKEAKLALEEKVKAFEGFVPASEIENAKTNAEKAYNEKLNAITITSKLETKLIAAWLDAEYAELIMSKADVSSLTVKEGKVIGLDDTVTMLKEKYPKMFGTVSAGLNNAGANKGGTPPTATLTAEEKLKSEIRKNMGLK